MPKIQSDLNATLMWSMLKLGTADALVSGFMPINGVITRNPHIGGAYYSYNKRYDHLVIIYPPHVFAHLPDSASSEEGRRLYELRMALNKPTSLIVELGLGDTAPLDEDYYSGTYVTETTLYERSPEIIRPETDEDREDMLRPERRCRRIVLDRKSELGIVSLVQKLQYLCDENNSYQKMHKLLQQDINVLHAQLDSFSAYAEEEQNIDLVSFAAFLKREVANFFDHNTAITSAECANFKVNFMRNLHVQDSIINTTGKQIIANILITLTGIGALLLLIKLANSAYKTGSPSFFFSKQVETQRKIDVIASAVTKLTEPQLTGPTPI